jgi:hypothetical protein
MENQLSVRLNNEQKPLKISKSEEIANFLAPSSLAIRNLNDDEPIKQNLRFAFVLIGLREDQIPNQIERGVLIQFIRSSFPNLVPDEIRIAFELATRGDLNIDANPFGSFSALYFSKIINAYLQHKNRVSIDVRSLEDRNRREIPSDVSPEELDRIGKEFDQTVILPMFEKFKSYQRIELNGVPPQLVYNRLLEVHSIIELSKEEKVSLWARAEAEQKRKKEDLLNGKARNMNEHRLKLKLIEAFNDVPSKEEEMRNDCRIMVIQMCFEYLIKNNVDFKFYI